MVKAKSGAYGALPYDRAEGDARILLDAIYREMPDVDFFTREDCLQLPDFGHVSTITRYETIRLAVRWLLDAGELREMTRTDLALPDKARFYTGRHALQDAYMKTIKQCIAKLAKQAPGEPFSVMEVVDTWRSDAHMTVNTKRVLARSLLKRLVKEELLSIVDIYFYRVNDK